MVRGRRDGEGGYFIRWQGRRGKEREEVWEESEGGEGREERERWGYGGDSV